MASSDTVQTILKNLVSVTGPIDTFFIGPTGAAYTQLTIAKPENLPVKWRRSPKTDTYIAVKPKAYITNRIVGKPIKFDQSYADAARQHAINEGRIECMPTENIGKISERGAGWLLVKIANSRKFRERYRPHILKAITTYKKYIGDKRLSWPDPNKPDTLGWRVWHWDPVKRLLKSPSQGTYWHAGELRVPHWDTQSVVRGHAGIHAALMPYDWLRASLDGTELEFFKTQPVKNTIVGTVERYGKYVLGTEGWRAEWVIIKSLKATTTEIGLALEQAYPDVEVHYENR